jgi:NUMOD4 motif
MKEQWRPIEGFSRYEISNQGEIVNVYTGRPMKYRMNGNGSLMVDLTRDDGQYTRSVRYLVAKTFVKGRNDIFNTPILKDGNQQNCVATNIAWRPRWFAIEYRRQFREVQMEIQEYGPLVDDQEIKYQTVQDAAIVNGSLMRDIFRGLLTQESIFPDWRIYRLL